MELSKIVRQLFEIGAVKFGAFTLKSGITSPIYIDLRMIISFPSLLQTVANQMRLKATMPYDLICGVPYTALPIATAISLAEATPMVMRRKEAKDYGTKKIIEGVYTPGQQCLLIEDLITSGASIFETIEPLEEVGIIISEVIVFLDREQGGKEVLKKRGYSLQSVLNITQMLEILATHRMISAAEKKETLSFIHNT